MERIKLINFLRASLSYRDNVKNLIQNRRERKSHCLKRYIRYIDRQIDPYFHIHSTIDIRTIK